MLSLGLDLLLPIQSALYWLFYFNKHATQKWSTQCLLTFAVECYYISGDIIAQLTIPYTRLINWVICHPFHDRLLDKKSTIHQLTTMLSTPKNVLFPGDSHLQTTGVDVPSL